MARAGRKRKVGVRYPSGDLKPEDARETVAQARQRIFGVKADLTKTREAGLAIGRLLLSGKIEQEDFNAATAWGEAREAMRKAMDIAKPRSASDFSGAGGYDGREGDDEAYVEYCQRARRRYGDMKRAVLDADGAGVFALNEWLDSDYPQEALIPALKRAMMAIRRLTEDGRR